MLSLERKLPLLIGGLAVVVLVSTTAIAVTEVRRSSTLAAEQRLQRIGAELAGLAARGGQQREALFDSVAASAPVLRLLAGERDLAALDATLRRLRLPLDSGAPIQVLDAQRRVVYELRGARGRLAPPSERIPPTPSAYTPLETTGETAFYWVEAPVQDAGSVRGWVRQQRRIGSSAAAAALRGLIGASTEIYFAHRDGGAWVTLGGEPLLRPLPITGPGDFLLEHDGRRLLTHVDTVPDLPWLLVSAVPFAEVQDRTNLLLTRLLAVGTVLLLLVGLAAWAISRRVTAPVRELSRAADAIARGEYSVRANVESDDELGRLAHSFNTMAARVESARVDLELASDAKSEFLATMSHEVRTPINAVIGYADLLDAGTAGELTPRQRNYVERIRESGRHLTSIVDEVLDFSKIEAGRMGVRLQTVSGAEALRSALRLISGQAAAKQIDLQLTVDEECLVDVDPQRFRQILINLLSNAIKFTPESGRVSVVCEATEQPGGTLAHEPRRSWVAFRISDTGAGIDEDQHERIFEPFVQGSGGYTREHGGTGLGLAISRRLARLMGGEVTVSSRRGEGATFTVWLPKASVPAAAAASAPAAL